MAVETRPTGQRNGDLEPSAAQRLSGWLRGYQTLQGIPDELFDSMGRPRDHWLCFLGDFAEYPEGESKSRFDLATRHIRDTGVSYRIYGEESERSWPLNPLPLILGQREWTQIAAGVEQRANLMEMLLQDFYGKATLLADGALPAAALTGSADFLQAMRGVEPPGGRYLQIYAADLGRGPDGRWWVLDDRTQAPSGAGYALENRLVLSRAYPNLYTAMNVMRLAPFFEGLRKGLAARAGRSDPRICLLTPGPFSETYFEQAHLARYLGFLLVEGDDLIARDGKVYVRTIAGLKRADVILRRVDAEFIDPLELNSASRLGTPGMLEAIRAGGDLRPLALLQDQRQGFERPGAFVLLAVDPVGDPGVADVPGGEAEAALELAFRILGEIAQEIQPVLARAPGRVEQFVRDAGDRPVVAQPAGQAIRGGRIERVTMADRTGRVRGQSGSSGRGSWGTLRGLPRAPASQPRGCVPVPRSAPCAGPAPRRS